MDQNFSKISKRKQKKKSHLTKFLFKLINNIKSTTSISKLYIF